MSWLGVGIALAVSVVLIYVHRKELRDDLSFRRRMQELDARHEVRDKPTRR